MSAATRLRDDLAPLDTLDPRLGELRTRAQSDFRFFCKRFLKIKPKDPDLVKEGGVGMLIPFEWNEAQEIVWSVMRELLAAGMPIELVILKARQFGISTFFCAWIFWQMWRKMYTKAAIVAFRKDTTLKELNETMATFHASFPENFRPQLRQRSKTARVGKDDLYFDDRKSNCMFVVQSPDAMRGMAREIVLTTEVSFYKDASEFYGGFLPAMIKGATRLLVLESSAADGYFREQYEAAKEGRGVRRAIFLPWWIVPTLYSSALRRTAKRIYDAKTGDQVKLMPSERKEQEALTRMSVKLGRPPITDEQMYWRQQKIDEEYNGDEEFFNQEYPRDDTSAFERATTSAFKIALPLARKTSEETFDLYPDAQMGTLHSKTYTDPTIDQVVAFEPEMRDGWIDQERRPGLLMIRPPVEGHTYTIGADVASDVQDEDDSSERAFSTATVYCCNTREQVAEWRGHIDPHDWGDELVKLGYFYNTAMICVERNNMGVTTEDRIKRYLNYPIRFRWPDMNSGMSTLTKKEMWETNARTKIIMMGMLKQWLRDGLFLVRSPGLFFELSHYQIKNGRYQNGDAYSDRIIAAALSIQCVEQTDFAYKAIVLGANGNIPENPAAGAAERELKRTKGAPALVGRALPDEMRELVDLRVSDLWEMARL